MEFWTSTFYGNTIIEWGISLGIIIGSVIVAKVIFKLINKHIKKFADKTENKYDDVVVDKVEEPFTMFLIILGFYIGVKQLNLPEGTDNFLFGLAKLAAIINFTWMLTRTVSGLADEFAVQMARMMETSSTDSFYPY